MLNIARTESGGGLFFVLHWYTSGDYPVPFLSIPEPAQTAVQFSESLAASFVGEKVNFGSWQDLDSGCNVLPQEPSGSQGSVEFAK
jgi:hypothetical protein